MGRYHSSAGSMNISLRNWASCNGDWEYAHHRKFWNFELLKFLKMHLRLILVKKWSWIYARWRTLWTSEAQPFHVTLNQSIYMDFLRANVTKLLGAKSRAPTPWPPKLHDPWELIVMKLKERKLGIFTQMFFTPKQIIILASPWKLKHQTNKLLQTVF